MFLSLSGVIWRKNGDGCISIRHEGASDMTTACPKADVVPSEAKLLPTIHPEIFTN